MTVCIIYSTDDDNVVIDLLKDFTALVVISEIDNYVTEPVLFFID